MGGRFFYTSALYNMMVSHSTKGQHHCWKNTDPLLPRRQQFSLKCNWRHIWLHSHWESQGWQPHLSATTSSPSCCHQYSFFSLPVEPVQRAFMNFNLMKNMKCLCLHSNTPHKKSNILGLFLQKTHSHWFLIQVNEQIFLQVLHNWILGRKG